MHHVLAWSETSAAAGTLQPVAGVPDDIVFTEGDDFRIPVGYASLLGGFAAGTGTTRARLVAPSLRAFINHEIIPINTAQTFNDLLNSEGNLFVRSPIPLAVGEPLNFESDGGAAGPEDITGVVLLAGGPLQPVDGDIRTVRCTAAIAGARRVWTAGNLTFSEDLPAGRYAIVGGKCAFNAAAGAWRLIPREGGMRPGFIATTSAASDTPQVSRRGGMGVWMEFDVNQPPRLEVLSLGAASATQVLYLDIMRVR